MKTSSAVLVLAGVVVAQAGIGYRQHRERVTLDLALGHQRLIADGVSAFRDDSREASGADLDKARRMMADFRANRVLAFVGLKFRFGVIGLRELRVNLREMAQDPLQQAYWTRHGRFRWEEALAGDRIARLFVTEVEKAYAAKGVPGFPTAGALAEELAATARTNLDRGMPGLRADLADLSVPGQSTRVVGVGMYSADNCYQLDIEGTDLKPVVPKEDVAADRAGTVDTAVREALNVPEDVPLTVIITDLCD